MFRILISVELAQPACTWQLLASPGTSERPRAERAFRALCRQALGEHGVTLEQPFVGVGVTHVRGFLRALGYAPEEPTLVLRFGDASLVWRFVGRARGGEEVVVYAGTLVHVEMSKS